MVRLSSDEAKKQWAEVVARAWMDEKFKARLLQNPRQVLEEFGFEEVANMDLRIVENSPKSQYLILPGKPTGKLSETELHSIAASAAGNGDQSCWICV